MLPLATNRIKFSMKKIAIILAALSMGAISAFGQARRQAPPPAPPKDTVFFDKSFLDAGAPPPEKTEIHLVPKYYKAGILAPEQPIALTTAKKEAMELVKAKPSPLRKDCLNIIYTVDPIYEEGSITGAQKGTILIKWDLVKKIWFFSYLKYQLINIDQNACVFMYEPM